MYLVVFKDDFISRAAGKRKKGLGLGKESALGEYIGHLYFSEIVIFHQKFSRDNADFPLFAIKTLSRYLGAYPVRWNADNIVLVDKHVAVRVFGQAPGVYMLRSKYNLTYAAYGLGCGITDPKLLKEYGKRDFLRFQRPALTNVMHLQNMGESSSSFPNLENLPHVTIEEVAASTTVEEVAAHVTVEEPSDEPILKRAKFEE